MLNIGEMMEKETVKMKMREIVKSCFFVPSLQEAVLTSVEEHAERSDFLFGRLAGMHYQIFSEEVKESERIAAAVELLMLAGDILDDLMDQDSLETSWSKAPLTTSFHMAIGLLLAGQKAIADLPIDDDKKAKAQSYILSRLLQSLNGQHMDVTNGIQTEAEYIEMVKKKSGSLVAMACFVGTALAGAEKNTVIIEKYANDIGIAAQIDNDIDALYRWDEKNDIKAKKKSLPVLYMLASKRDNLLKQYFSNHIDYNELYAQKEKVIQQMEQEGAFYYAKVMSHIYKEKALQEIEKLDVDDRYKSVLKTIIL
ncbi:polyprenyl synthetase family protein [Parageobacillus thermoglucosidasius]|uniref:polyprenyl synthetase family protein n=1 Tax=Parageobacillus thermoglucosidasius TaxID=1426 RepID=UPI000E181C11|nr:polyprenyl synthetase family protein [Parageobacillus thermoglucosidasius]MED4906358.1 polyprenyl synthetase family protein [Parageobacillus thermoglucosidasius]MED4915879.1 polyprenyl synthetase family protein [Parageobacillus thermoglucosidasius]MED4946721.1 polyprenyl synthetase family protein [Parageobacillus thermoglucosidasius]MED4982916.1 polyprenyl synthetase family protein [Parageobacillus thermoglucosidasius]RDE28989.1 polyprenyl synthetase [Parageobacillus thermoglucosidasius]